MLNFCFVQISKGFNCEILGTYNKNQKYVIQIQIQIQFYIFITKIHTRKNTDIDIALLFRCYKRKRQVHFMRYIISILSFVYCDGIWLLFLLLSFFLFRWQWYWFHCSITHFKCQLIQALLKIRCKKSYWMTTTRKRRRRSKRVSIQYITEFKAKSSKLIHNTYQSNKRERSAENV